MGRQEPSRSASSASSTSSGPPRSVQPPRAHDPRAPAPSPSLSHDRDPNGDDDDASRLRPTPPPPRPVSRLLSSSARIPSSLKPHRARRASETSASSSAASTSNVESRPRPRTSPSRRNGSTLSVESTARESQRSASRRAVATPLTGPSNEPRPNATSRPSNVRHANSTASSTGRDGRERGGGEGSAKKPNARPANVAGPATSNGIGNSMLRRFDSDRNVIGGGGGGTDTASGSSAVDESVATSTTGGGAGKPVWAMGGVFPNKQKRRRSSVARDWAKAREQERKELEKQRRKGESTTIEETSSRTDGDAVPSEVIVEHDDPFDRYRGGGGGSDAEDTERGGKAGSQNSQMSRGGSTASHPVLRQDHESHTTQDAEGDGAEDDASLREQPSRESQLDRKVSPGSSTLAEQDRSKGAGNIAGPSSSREEHEKEGRGGYGTRDDDDDDDDDDEAWSHGSGESDTSQQPQVGGQLNQNKEDWQDDFDAAPDGPPVRNVWGTIRFVLREPMAEFLGTLMLVVLGIGADCQTKISGNTAGDYSSQNWTWGFAVMISVYVAGGISGGHTNPAVTISLALFRGFPWKMVPRYVLAQVFGAFCGALMIYGNYKRAIHDYDPNHLIHASADPPLNASATLFITAPAQQVGTTPLGFAQEVLAGGILMIAVLALGDENNAPPGAGLGAIVLGFVVVAIGMSNGWVSGYAINPARDLGPRFALWVVGYGTKVWTHDDCWWIFGPILGPLAGSLGGCLTYDLLIFSGPGSPVNWSSHELAASVGLPQMHRMVKYATDPKLRRARRQPERDLEATLPPGVLQRAELTGRQRPGRRGSTERRDLEVIQRWRRGKEKVGQQEFESKERYEEARRKSADRARSRWREREAAVREAYAAEHGDHPNDLVVDSHDQAADQQFPTLHAGP
ncbi:hypothetical protein JCM10212_006083 [Sporobolomyces blumeae]